MTFVPCQWQKLTVNGTCYLLRQLLLPVYDICYLLMALDTCYWHLLQSS